MSIFPNKEYNFTTTLGVEEALRRFSDAIEPRQLFRFFAKAKPFEGQIKGQGAEFTPVTTFRNSFRPFIRVNVLQHDAGSRIRVKMKMLPSVVFTLSLLCILPTLTLLPALYEYFTGHTLFPDRTRLALLLPLAGIFVCRLGFAMAAPAARKKIETLFADTGYREL